MENHIVIMAGGVGSRLFPLSTPERPKQFLDLLGTGKTLLQMTVERFLPVCPKENMWVVTSENYIDFVKSQVPEIDPHHILAEPAARNTAPCIAYACRKIGVHHPGSNIIVAPSDALVLDNETFCSMMRTALKETTSGDKIVTIGITPTFPHTGYGYIYAPGCKEGKVSKVDSFKEKPDAVTAQKYLDDGNYLWNAGIFVWNAATINNAIRKFAPSISGIMDRLEPSFYTPAEKEQLAVLFPQCEKISIDYAVMEKSKDIYVIPGEIGWSDLGSFEAIQKAQKKLGDKLNPAAIEAVNDILAKKSTI